MNQDAIGLGNTSRVYMDRLTSRDGVKVRKINHLTLSQGGTRDIYDIRRSLRGCDGYSVPSGSRVGDEHGVLSRVLLEREDSCTSGSGVIIHDCNQGSSPCIR